MYHYIKAIYVKTETSRYTSGDDANNDSGIIDGVTYESIRIVDPRWIPVYVVGLCTLNQVDP